MIAHNIRSTHNVGSLLRTCDGLGITKVYLTGYTPFPKNPGDQRLPHIAEKLHNQISKTALGAEEIVAWEHQPDIEKLLRKLTTDGYDIAALEQTKSSVSLPSFASPAMIALLIGEEVNGVSKSLLDQCSWSIEIPMFGKKESFNVSVAAAIALYQLRFH